jgi:hypothetical protein
MSERALRLVRVAVLFLLLAMLLLAQQTGLLAQFTDPARARAALNAMGAWGFARSTGCAWTSSTASRAERGQLLNPCFFFALTAASAALLAAASSG